MRRTDAFYAAVGRFALRWSELEMALDLLILLTRRLAPKDLGALPHQFKEKIKFLRRRLRDAEGLADYKEKFDLLLKEAENFAKSRHDLIHSAIIHHHPQRSGMIVTMTRLLQPKGNRRPPISLTARTIRTLARLVEVTGNEAFDLAARLSSQMIKDNSH